MTTCESKKGLRSGRAAGWGLVILVFTALALLPAASRSQCYFYCTCTCGQYVGSENFGPFYSSAQCHAAQANAEYRCSTGGAICVTSCSPCSGCDPAPAPQTAPSQPSQPSQPPPPPVDPVEEARKYYEKQQALSPEEVQKLVNQNLDDQAARMQEAMNKRAEAGSALSQLNCSEQLARQASGMIQSGLYQEAADLAQQSENAMNGRPTSAGCGQENWMKYQVPEVPPPQAVMAASPGTAKSIQAINQGMAELNQAVEKSDQSRAKLDQARQDKKFWEQEIKKIKQSKPPKAEAEEDDILAQAMAALEQSESALGEAEQEYQDAQKSFEDTRKKVDKDVKALKKSPQKGGRP